ncbi:unnamed protein product [Prorocentrum cordatum]|uniref:Uncharacterized protein n=1 Tax=Prorocentrum cordatum TaxID=2364126 RepID=A0ABN9RGE1_9DINO|nr:unnamed protein product [Polarella glacialis]
MAAKPFKFSVFLAAATQSAYIWMVDVWYRLRWTAEAFFETSLLDLVLISFVLCESRRGLLLPRNTMARPNLPLPILLTRFAFMTFLPFASEFFMAGAFIGSAIEGEAERRDGECGCPRKQEYSSNVSH